MQRDCFGSCGEASPPLQVERGIAFWLRTANGGVAVMAVKAGVVTILQMPQ